MDEAIRSKIMGSILQKQTTQEAITEEKKVSKGLGEREFLFKDKLKYVHAYERIIKEDSEDWSDENWAKFEKWYIANKPKPKSMDLVTSAFEKKAEREKKELEERRAMRKQILEKVKFKL